jgi:hypothetical protein
MAARATWFDAAGAGSAAAPLQIRSVVTKFDQYSSRSSDQAAAEESEVGREEALQTKGIAR